MTGPTAEGSLNFCVHGSLLQGGGDGGQQGEWVGRGKEGGVCGWAANYRPGLGWPIPWLTLLHPHFKPPAQAVAPCHRRSVEQNGLGSGVA